MDEPDTGDLGTAEVQKSYIPCAVFLFSGLTVNSEPGTDPEGNKWGPPQEYDNSRGNGTDYPPGLDLYNFGYTRPPEGWPGVEIDGKTLKVFVAEDGINDDNTAIAGNVYQTLFPQYNDYYVYRVTVQGSEVEVLGVIQLPRQDGYEYIYYYQTDRDQNTDVSATTLPDGVEVRVEYLLAFEFNSQADNPVQRHYRIKVENARSNVSVTGMNLMLYSIGNPEFSIYDIDGITGATVPGSAHVEAIQYYDKGTNSDGSAVGWGRGNKYKANVVVDYYTSGIDYDDGDLGYGGANIRFKVAEGYGSPYYLYESTREGVIDSAEKAANGGLQPQALDEV